MWNGLCACQIAINIQTLNQPMSVLLNGPGNARHIPAFLTAPILLTFVASFGRCMKMLMVPCSVLCGRKEIHSSLAAN